MFEFLFRALVFLFIASTGVLLIVRWIVFLIDILEKK